MKRLLVFILGVMASAAPVVAQIPQAIQTGFTVERELAGADRHNYEVKLSKGQVLSFVVEQRGVDVVLRVLAADGELYDRVDTPSGTQGDESIQVVSPGGGRYRLEIRRWSNFAPAGKYFIKTVAVRAATAAELKAARLKEELLKIVREDARSLSSPESLKRHYLDRALLTNLVGDLHTTTSMLEGMAKYPFKPPPGFSFEAEVSEARAEDLGGVVVMSVRQSYRLKNPQTKTDRTANLRLGYVFKRVAGRWRIACVQRTIIDRERQPIKLAANQLETLVGVYDGGKTGQTLSLTREGDALYGKFSHAEGKFELTPETENTFYAGFLSIAFIRDAGGAVTQAVVQYALPEDRLVIQPKIK